MSQLIIKIASASPAEDHSRILVAINRAGSWYAQLTTPREEDKEHMLTLLDIQQNMLESGKNS